MKIVLGVLAVILAIVLFANLRDLPSRDGGEAFDEVGFISANEERVKATLKDPGSAMFRNVRIGRGLGAPAVCGEVNAKNSFGGYLGYNRFV